MNTRLANEITIMVNQERRDVMHGVHSFSSSEQSNLHSNRLKQIIESEGWPTPEMVGEAASKSAFILLNSIDDDDFKKDCLHKMKEAFKTSKGNVLKEQIDDLSRKLNM